MSFLSRNQLALSAFFLFVISAQLMSVSVANPKVARAGSELVVSFVSPLLKLQHESIESVKYLWNRYFWLVNVEGEKKDLESRVKELESMNSRLLEYQNENIRLRNILHYSEELSLKGVVASVIGSDHSNWFKTIVLDKGSSSGLKEGLAVVSGNAVVGQIVSVSSRSSKVLLLVDTSSAIDTIIQSSRMWGIAEGKGLNKSLRLNYVEKSAEKDVSVGDRLITSGLDGVYPKGLLVGVIESVDFKSSSLFYDIKLIPAINTKQIENVFVVLPKEMQEQNLSSDNNSLKVSK